MAIPEEIRQRVIFKSMGICERCQKVGIIGLRNNKLAVWEIGGFHGIKPFEFHHKTPVRLGGEDTESNIALLCQPCHRRTSMEERELYKKRRSELECLKNKKPPEGKTAVA